jgi:FkbM family methyltransferase
MFGKLVSIEMSLRENKARKFIGGLLRKLWPNFRLSTFLLKAGGNEQRVKVFGKWMYVDLWDSAVATNLFVNHVWEPEETNLISALLRKGDVFVDIGANIGYFTLLASGVVGSAGKVFAFEPSPRNFRLLRKNVETNRCQNVQLEAKAIMAACKPLTLHLSNINFGDHRVYASHDDATYNQGAPRSEVQVEGITLDSYFPSGVRVDLVKMDVQGAEYFALQGMKRVLLENHDILCVMEFWRHGLIEAGASPQALLQELMQLGFIMHRIDHGEVVPAPVDEILSVDEHEVVNLLLARKQIAMTVATVPHNNSAAEGSSNLVGR